MTMAGSTYRWWKMTDQRIKLAEFVGWWRDLTWNEATERHIEMWTSRHGEVTRSSPPDPRNDACDCEALIRKLREIGYETQTVALLKEHYVYIYDPSVEPIPNEYEWHGDDWKAGVCDLAEKIIDES